MTEHNAKVATDEKEKYLQACKNSDVVPVSFFLKHGNEEVMNLNHRGLGDRGLAALSTLLEVILSHE